MVKLNYNTKKAQYYINAWRNSTITDICQAYKKPSTRKCSAFAEIIHDYAKFPNAAKLRIISSNTNFFSTAYALTDTEGCFTALIVNTPHNAYYIDMEVTTYA